jgi:hypothetical protein
LKINLKETYNYPLPAFNDPLGLDRAMKVAVTDSIGFESYDANTNQFTFNPSVAADIGNFILNFTL